LNAVTDGWNYYTVDENEDGATDYAFYSPSLDFLEFRSNMVIRWEYIPGSTLYLVWSQGRDGLGQDSEFSMPRYMNALFSEYPQNVLLIKLSYMFVY
jgi:hypothetical protein